MSLFNGVSYIHVSLFNEQRHMYIETHVMTCVSIQLLNTVIFMLFVGLFFRISSLLQGSFAIETYNFMDPTSQSHPIFVLTVNRHMTGYGVAKISRLLKIVGRFCKRALQKRR